MTIHNQTKINQLLQSWLPGTVAMTHWLEEKDISRQLQAHYQKSGWIEPLGVGAFKRYGDTINWKGALYTLQKEAKLPVHAGGLTAAVLQGAGHYVRFKENIQLFSSLRMTLPKWFREQQWEGEIEFYRTTFLPESKALTEYEDKTFSITLSSLERAILECLYLAPKHLDLVECYHIMEGLAGLRPAVLQELLEQCSSVKVKRLFLYMAEKANHPWLSYLNTKAVDLGKGKRSIVRQGVYNSKYQITVPSELEA